MRTKFEIGDKVFYDFGLLVTVISQTEKRLFTTVQSKNGDPFRVMTYRLTGPFKEGCSEPIKERSKQ